MRKRAPEVSDSMARAAVAAIEHLDRLGTPALVDAATCRALRRIGQHKVADRMATRMGAGGDDDAGVPT